MDDLITILAGIVIIGSGLGLLYGIIKTLVVMDRMMVHGSPDPP